MPTEVNASEAYRSFGELEDACAAFYQEVNRRLHPMPEEPYTSAFGHTSTVSRSCLISVGGVRYAVPYLVDETVWVRDHGSELVMVHGGKDGLREVARHRRSTPGHAQLKDEQYPLRSAVHAQGQRPYPTNPREEGFLAIGQGPRTWLVEARVQGRRDCPAG